MSFVNPADISLFGFAFPFAGNLLPYNSSIYGRCPFPTQPQKNRHRQQQESRFLSQGNILRGSHGQIDVPGLVAEGKELGLELRRRKVDPLVKHGPEILGVLCRV